MITGVHTMFYSSEATAMREFLRSKMGFPCSDVGEGWLIFDLPEAEIGVHPADESIGAISGQHHISFYCDNITKTVAQLEKKGVEFTEPVKDLGYGHVTMFKMPGGFTVQLYEPKYKKGGAKPKAAAKKPMKAKAKVVKKSVKVVAKKKAKKKK